MFNTFVAVPDPTGFFAPSSSEASKATTKVKRKQVARACNLCRTNRIRCDDNIPCSNCRAKRNNCSKSGHLHGRKKSTASREIHHLHSKLKAVERVPSDQSQGSQSGTLISPPFGATPLQSVSSPITPDHGTKCTSWPGIRLEHVSTGNVQYYGPCSSFDFVDKISSFLNSVLTPSLSTSNLIPGSGYTSHKTQRDTERSHREMPFTQQESLLNLFWQTYHVVFPIVCEYELRDHFKSLWRMPQHFDRHPSPLVDIMLALCIQYGHTFLEDQDSSSSLDLKSTFYYSRSRAGLAIEAETPSISTLQAYVFVILYLQNLSDFNAAHLSLAIAVRIAFTLGLHLEPLEHLSRQQQEHQRRLWWSLFVLDVKLSLELGQPWIINLSQISCRLPTDDPDLVKSSCANFLALTSAGNTNWLSFYLHNIRLSIAARSAHDTFFSKTMGILASSVSTDFYRDSPAMENCAAIMRSSMEPLLAWAKEIPNGLTIRRKESGMALSIDRAPLEIELTDPVWIQIQRATLELSYHNFSLTLYRLFVRFKPHHSSATPLGDGLAIMALNHASTITRIAHEILSKHDTLAGWYDIYHTLWSAALTMQGFVIAYAVCPPTPAARRSIKVAIETFDLLQKDIPLAADAAAIMRNLNSKARLLLNRFKVALDVPAAQSGRMVDSSAQGSVASVQSPSPGLGEILNLPAGDPTQQFESDMWWPDLDQYNEDMWANFLHDLKGSIPGTEEINNVDIML